MAVFDLNLSPESLAMKLAGLVGAVVSMGFLKGTLPERAFMALSGAALSFYAAPWAAGLTGLPEGLTGFLIGFFGMAILSKAWEWWQSAPVGVWLTTAIKQRLGIKDAPSAAQDQPKEGS